MIGRHCWTMVNLRLVHATDRSINRMPHVCDALIGIRLCSSQNKLKVELLFPLDARNLNLHVCYTCESIMMMHESLNAI